MRRAFLVGVAIGIALVLGAYCTSFVNPATVQFPE